jgi:hypothetical protein
MTTRTDDAQAPRTEQESGIWDLVSVADYRLPQTPATRAARARWVSLKRLFGGRRPEDEAPARAEADLRRLPERQLDAVAAAVNWTAAAAVLQHRLETGDGGAVRFVVGPPHSGHVELLRRWGTEQGARWIEPPAYQDILEMGPAWLAGWPSEVGRWVMPRLEHCWLRHSAGLALVRELLDRALSGRLGRGVIGCDSWAWAYLRYLAPLPTRSVLTLQAFDGDRLATLFRALVAADGPGRVRFCNARTGKLILAVDRKDEDGDDDEDENEDDGNGGTELQSLAARCRGNAGLARDLWRARLSTAPESEPDAEGGATDGDAVSAADGDDDGTTVWVAEPAEEPAIAADRDEELALVLHALLLHNGLPGPLLAELLPLPPFRVQAILHRLAGAGVAAAGQGGHWHVTAAGYPPARNLLQAQGLLLDDF